VDVDRRRFTLRIALILAADLNARYSPVVVPRMLAGSIDQQVFLFIDQVLTVKLAHLEIRGKLDGVGRAGLFAQAAKDTTREIDAKELWKTPPVFILSCLERNTIDGTNDRTEIARHAALTSIGITRQNDPAPVAWSEIRLLLRILNGDSFLEGMKEHVPNRSKYADHPSTPNTYFAKHHSVSSKVQKTNQIALSALSIL
jgi:hypothetical protein